MSGAATGYFAVVEIEINSLCNSLRRRQQRDLVQQGVAVRRALGQSEPRPARVAVPAGGVCEHLGAGLPGLRQHARHRQHPSGGRRHGTEGASLDSFLLICVHFSFRLVVQQILPPFTDSKYWEAQEASAAPSSSAMSRNPVAGGADGNVEVEGAIVNWRSVPQIVHAVPILQTAPSAPYAGVICCCNLCTLSDVDYCEL